MFWISFIVTLVAIFFFNTIKLVLTGLGLPVSLSIAVSVIVVLFILFAEIVLKFLFLETITPFKPSETSLEDYKHLDLDLDKFNFYCNDLEKIGFKKLTDYTCPPMKGMARLFYYPEHNCYAEVGLLEGFSAFFSIVGGFERNWFFAATNNDQAVNLRAISYVFLSLPRTILKNFKEEPEALFSSFLTWQSEMKNKLAVEEIKITDAEMYFTWERNRKKIQRQRLMRKSMIISLIKMFLFTLNPKSEWLGDCPKSAT